MKMSGQRHAPVILPGMERNLGTQSVGGWVGFRGAADTFGEEKSLLPPPGINPGVSRP